jgi:hypothetical protein
MSEIELLRGMAERYGWNLSLQEHNLRYRNNHTGEDVDVVLEYHIEKENGVSTHQYSLSDGAVWPIDLFNEHFKAV